MKTNIQDISVLRNHPDFARPAGLNGETKHLHPFKRSQSKVPKLPSQPRESEIQLAIVGTLEALGYFVLHTSEGRRRVQCPHCRDWFTPANGTGLSPGVPDLLVTSGAASKRPWPAGVWVGLEVKKPKGSKIRPAQKSLADAGRIYIVRSAAEALAAVREVETTFNPK